MKPYNKDEVMKGIYAACYDYLGVMFTSSREENQEKFSKELSSALDQAFQAGRQSERQETRKEVFTLAKSLLSKASPEKKYERGIADIVANIHACSWDNEEFDFKEIFKEALK